ncbi:uncharacterized protein LOC127879324 [Dreissena polymorpha]|uniref:uncharacterized protein LOC127879324 n=1 Tax=Dreissena polymorpha TaxID=45954 RepID=UPI0022645961|nr:uncharacterized protein LOC127879324 [Dreissena polymorpha]
MPRKKKKSILEKKPSLLFLESPLHIQHNVPTPVLCARHPPTADTVPVENLQHLTWVSPQFRYSAASTSDCGKRHTRRRRHSIASHKVPLVSDLQPCNKENRLHNQTVNRLRKYRSLKFLGDRTAVQSVIEDVEVTINDHYSTASESEAPQSGADDITNDSPEINWDAFKRRITRCRTRSAEYNKHSTASLEPKLKRKKNGMAVSDQEQLQSGAPVKRLFSDNIPFSSSICIPKIVAKANIMETEHTGRTDDARHPVLDSDTHVSETSEEETKSPHIRRSDRLLFLQSQKLPTKVQTILAPDTPESEYGWSIRQRQLIKDDWGVEWG